MQTEWDAEQEVVFDPPKDKQFVGGEPVKERRKNCPKVQFSFNSARLAELQTLAAKEDWWHAGHGFFELGKQFDRGEGVDIEGGRCLEKAFQCYMAAFREGYVPAVEVLSNRVRGADDTEAIRRANGAYVPLYEATETDTEPTEKIFIGADAASASFPIVSEADDGEDDMDSRW